MMAAIGAAVNATPEGSVAVFAIAAVAVTLVANGYLTTLFIGRKWRHRER